MSYALYAMDTSFYTPLGAYDFDARCTMLADLGYGATYLTLWSEEAWQDVPRLASVKERYGLDVAAVYVTLDIAGAIDHAGNNRILRLLQTLDGCQTVEITMVSGDTTVHPSDPAGDPAATTWLRQLLAVAERRDITLALYPHITRWLERSEDAVRLCRAIDHPLLRAVFCGFHWYAVDGTHLPARLEEAAPYLHLVNICGSRRTVSGNGPMATIEPLDEGDLDNFAMLGLLREVGYRGLVGVQGYSVGGDVYAKLKRSLTAFRDMERRLDAHPEWSRLRWA